ncbi:MAG TPA: helix-turn-helix transcriptional regulator [Candidatus Polarisedimenticolaceae bacterium]|nr:helix-turn-helix transcriptional regulator [Candidatus Polarisedimenticolaceae bacterium]
MAESSSVALGRYFRELRERRDLSLAGVCALTRSSPEPIDKGTLSRLERGQQTPSIFRLGPLCRIYGISGDAMLERLELDREIDRLGGPDTTGLEYQPLHEAGTAAAVRTKRKWDAYAFFRDALPLAPAERRPHAWINLVTAIRSLGKNALALHELRAIDATTVLEPPLRALLQERLSQCCRSLGDMRNAEAHADAAISQARAHGDRRILAHAYAARGSVALDESQWTAASDFFLKARAADREAAQQDSRLVPSPSFETYILVSLAECALGLGQLARTRRLALAANRLSRKRGLTLSLAYSEIFLGRVDEAAGRRDRALDRWRRAAELAKRIDHPRIAFSAGVEMLRLAITAGDRAWAGIHRRRLERIAPFVPHHIPAYRVYMGLLDDDRSEKARAEKEKRHGVPMEASSAVVGGRLRVLGGASAAHRRRRPRSAPSPGGGPEL